MIIAIVYDVGMLKVSIIVPIYNVEKYIERCAVSLFEQTYSNIEYVFVNDCTPDQSITVLKRVIDCYPHRASQTKIINHDYNCGVAISRNTALEHSTGEFVCQVDPDDYIELDAFDPEDEYYLIPPTETEMRCMELTEYLEEITVNDKVGREKVQAANDIVWKFCNLHNFEERYSQLQRMIDSGTVKFPGGFAVGEITKMLNPEYIPNIR